MVRAPSLPVSGVQRRRLLVLAAAGLVAPSALAGPRSPGFSLPLRIAYARLAPAGLVQPARAEREAFSALRVRTGEVIAEIEPLPLGGLFNLAPPETDGGAGSILLARQLAQASGHDTVLLYATEDGQRTYPAGGSWIARAFASLRSAYGPYDPANGEAHLFAVAGGAPLLSVASDAAPRIAVNPFDRRVPEQEAFDTLVADLELRLQALAARWLTREQSIAD
jgi:hypothetical protein